VGGKGRTTFTKRQKEAARKRKAQEKVERRAERAAEKKERGPLADGEDPDIAGIVPGPQPLPEGFGSDE
jgi:hypothetical protein